MNNDLIFYANPMSRSRIVRWMLEEAGCEYRTEIISFGPGSKSPTYLAINPMGKVPAIQHSGVVVTECAAICAYLADYFSEAGLAPGLQDPARGTYYRWLFFAAGPFEAATSNQSLGFVVPTAKEGMMGYGNYERTIAAFESAVSDTDYIAGGKFSAADVYVGSQIGFGLQFGTLEKRPAFEKYWDRISARPAYIKAKTLDDALMKHSTSLG